MICLKLTIHFILRALMVLQHRYFGSLHHFNKTVVTQAQQTLTQRYSEPTCQTTVATEHLTHVHAIAKTRRHYHVRSRFLQIRVSHHRQRRDPTTGELRRQTNRDPSLTLESLADARVVRRLTLDPFVRWRGRRRAEPVARQPTGRFGRRRRLAGRQRVVRPERRRQPRQQPARARRHRWRVEEARRRRRRHAVHGRRQLVGRHAVDGQLARLRLVIAQQREVYLLCH